MPGVPAEGGWGGAGRTLGIQMEGFSEEEIARAVDFCDNDRIKTIKYLQKMKSKSGATSWKSQLEAKLQDIEPKIRELCKKLLAYDNVPTKQKAFVNFAKNSLALQRQPQLAEKMWEIVGDMLKKPTSQLQPAAEKEEKEKEDDDSKEDKQEKKKKKKSEQLVAGDEEEDEEKEKKKKKKKDKKKDGASEKSDGEVEEAKKSKKPKAEKEQDDDDEDTKKKKKEKKKEKESKSDDMDLDEDDEKSKKKQKKKDKEKELGKSKDHEEDVEMEEDKAKMKKDKKRKREEKDEEEEGSAKVKEDKEKEDQDGKKKKNKKEKKQEVEEEERETPKTNGFDFYKEKKTVKKMGKEEVDAFRESVNLKVENCNLNPILAFDDLPVIPDLLQCCAKFDKPTSIQCWPVCLSGRDLVGIAATGSGKTLAFGLPGLTHILSLNQAKAPHTSMLVLAPTRELAMQSAVVLESAGKPLGIKTVCIYGGAPKAEQKKQLKGGAQILVATPGRLLDFMEEGVIELERVTFLVLDEADRMVDVGFEKEVRRIIGACAKKRQTVMFSATWPQSIQKIAAEFLSDPARVTVGSEDLAANHRVKQIVEVLEPAAKDRRLLEVLRQYHNGKNRIIIFALYKKECDRVHSLVESKTSFKVGAIHGDRGQEARTAAIEAFKAGKVPLLIATDVAARGLDIPDVEFVINYTFPLTTEDYVHRIGRTGRAGKEGVSHTFFTSFDKARAGELCNVLREAGQEVPEALTKFGTHVKKKEHKLFGAHFKDVDLNQKATKVKFDSEDEDE